MYERPEDKLTEAELAFRAQLRDPDAFGPKGSFTRWARAVRARWEKTAKGKVAVEASRARAVSGFRAR